MDEGSILLSMLFTTVTTLWLVWFAFWCMDWVPAPWPLKRKQKEEAKNQAKGRNPLRIVWIIIKGGGRISRRVVSRPYKWGHKKYGFLNWLLILMSVWTLTAYYYALMTFQEAAGNLGVVGIIWFIRWRWRRFKAPLKSKKGALPGWRG